MEKAPDRDSDQKLIIAEGMQLVGGTIRVLFAVCFRWCGRSGSHLPEWHYGPVESGSHLHVLEGVVPSESVCLSPRQPGEQRNIILFDRLTRQNKGLPVAPIIRTITDRRSSRGSI
jgi:hypothetical protein